MKFFWLRFDKETVHCKNCKTFIKLEYAREHYCFKSGLAEISERDKKKLYNHDLQKLLEKLLEFVGSYQG